MSVVEQIQIPDKLFYKINEVSTLTQVKPYVLRYWETEFPMLTPEKDEHDQRRYRKGDIEIILQIKRLLYDEKFTIAGARKQLKVMCEGGQAQVKSFEGARPGSHRVRRINSSLTELRRDLAEICKIIA
ncbi:MAG: MerR family transcriptional regulator [bacterium]|nr:MerR family transcriptional regulator [Candidatus Sumerlaeota bacterium]